MTENWSKEKLENSCERPADGSNRARYKIFAQEEPLNAAIGGGIRVKDLTVSSDTYSSKTVYSYLTEDDLESGVTSYAPSKRDRMVPYITELPNPFVLYENVTAKRLDVNQNVVHKKVYTFNVPKQIQFLSRSTLVENAFEIKRIQNDNFVDISLNNEDVDMAFSKYEVRDYSAGIGRLTSSKEYNSENQVTSILENTYLPNDHSFTQGILQESFNSYKWLYDSPNKSKYLMTSSSKLKVPNVLSKTIIKTGGISKVEERLKFDFFTGQVTESTTELSDGKLLKSRFIPAYTKYSGMGSKVDASNSLAANKNMLSQEAMSITEIQKEDGSWAKISANATSWNPQTYTTTTTVGEPPNDIDVTRYINVWRKHKSFVWDGMTDTNGYFSGYVGNDDSFDWSGPNAVQPAQWKKLSEITKYNDFSVPLEVTDINGNKTSSKMDYENVRTIAVFNAGYGEAFYSGAEDESGLIAYGGDVKKGTAQMSTDAHTGSHSLQIASGQHGYQLNVDHNQSNPKKFKISLWAKSDTYQNVKLSVGSSIISHNIHEEVHAGNWVQLNFYTDIADGTQVSVTSNSGSVIVDDFRLHPIASSMRSFVYNEWDELTHIIGSNNMATKYEYDAEGRLFRTYTEVEDFNGSGTGGFKPTTQMKYTYKHLDQ
jgi:hypothetical protein